MSSRPSPRPTVEEIRQQTARILQSARFVRAKRQAEILEFIMREYLSGDCPLIKEYRIGEAMFGGAGFDPSQDSSVRQYARRLRESLSDYYGHEGRFDPVVIAIPKGGYVPECSYALRADEKTASTQIRSRTFRWIAALAALVMVCFVALWAPRRSPVSSGAFRPAQRMRRFFASSTSEGKIVRRIDLPESASFTLMTPDGRKLYGLAADGRSMFVTDPRSFDRIRKIPLPRQSQAPRFSPGAAKIYLGSPEPGLLVLDTKTDLVDRRIIPTPRPVEDFVVSPDGRHAYLGLGQYGLTRLDLGTGETRILSSMRWVGHLELDHAGKNLYVAWESGGPDGRPGHDVVQVIDLQTEKTVRVIRPVANVGARLAMSPNDEVVLISSRDACWDPKYDHFGCAAVPSHPFYLARRNGPDSPDQVTLPGFAGEAEFFPLTQRVHLYTVQDAVVWHWGNGTVLERWPTPSYAPRSVITPSEDRLILSLSPDPQLLVFDAEPVACMPPEPGLKNWYPVDGSLHDTVQGGRLRAEGSVNFAPGISGRALVFDGRSTALHAENATPWCLRCDQAMTESFFVNVDASSNDGTLLDVVARRGMPGRRIVHKGRQLVLESRIAGSSEVLSITSGPSITPGRWWHVALVIEGNRRLLYVDGVRQGEQTVAMTAIHEGSFVTLGATGPKPQNFFLGRIDELAVYDRALKAGEVAALARRPGCPP